MSTVIILRGPSGSGKSTYIKQRSKVGTGAGWVCSADKYFINCHGVYEFDPTKLPEAHASCMKSFLAALKRKIPLIYVDNTNTHDWEWTNYSRIARLMDYRIEIVEFVPETLDELKIVAARNQHGVPLGVVANQALNFEPVAPTLKTTQTFSVAVVNVTRFPIPR